MRRRSWIAAACPHRLDHDRRPRGPRGPRLPPRTWTGLLATPSDVESLVSGCDHAWSLGADTGSDVDVTSGWRPT